MPRIRPSQPQTHGEHPADWSLALDTLSFFLAQQQTPYLLKKFLQCARTVLGSGETKVSPNPWDLTIQRGLGVDTQIVPPVHRFRNYMNSAMN